MAADPAQAGGVAPADPTARNPWALYDALIEGVPDGIVVTDALVNRWAALRTDTGAVGLGMSYEAGPRSCPDDWAVRGRPLRDVARYAKSWDLRLASLGVAALNAWYATPERLDALAAAGHEVVRGRASNFFRRHAGILGVRKTAIVGHFPDVDDLTGDVTVLERRTRGNDLPDPACEYVLPGCELVAITGSTVVNKTLPRLLELAKDAEVHLVGPTAPPSLDAYPPCVVEFAGSVVVDPDECWRLAGLGLRTIVESPALDMFSISLEPVRHPDVTKGSTT